MIDLRGLGERVLVAVLAVFPHDKQAAIGEPEPELIYEQVVVTRQMPLSNMTEITEEERLIIGAWVTRGAATD